MKLFNTLGRQLQEFKPIKAGQVNLYTCGPTVYDTAQIGNLRTFVFYDTLRRALEAERYQVNHVMNITDVGHLTSDADEGDDKLEKGAKREGKTVWQIAEHYTDLFMSDMRAMNNLQPKYAKATDYIEAQIEMIKRLIDGDFAYKTGQAIYFDVSKLPDYGKLTGQKLNEKETAVRAEVVKDPAKHNPEDFAVWFFATGKYAHHEMRWPSPWGEGFPGWHLECSAIIHETLGEPIDIHTGGVDLIGTHHTNEMAQTEAAYGVELAHYWVHGEHLLVDGKKMSKSSGNFITLKDIVDKGYDPLALRLLFLQAHYRSQMNFTWDSLDGAQAFLKKLQNFSALRFQAVPGGSDPFSAKIMNSLYQFTGDDLNTPAALAEVARIIDLTSETPFSEKSIGRLWKYIELLDDLFGLELENADDVDQPTKERIAKREEARKNKDFARSDELRAKLEEQGIGLRDTDHGPIWCRL